MRSFIVLGLGVVIATAAFGEEAVVPALDYQQMAELNGYDQKQIDSVLAGEIVSRKIDEHSNKQLGLGLAMLIRVPTEQLYRRVVSAASYKGDEFLVAHAAIENPMSPEDSLSGLVLPETELQQLRKVKAGSDWNLSTDEIAALRAVIDDGGSDGALMEVYRSILAERVKRYASRGFEGIARYDRGGGNFSDAAEDLRSSVEPIDGLRIEAPVLFRALTSFPEHQPAGLESRFYWLLQTVQDRPSVILTHRMMGMEEGRIFVSERHYYTARSYNALQELALGLPVDAGTFVFYSNRTSTDQITGFGASVARKIGRSFLSRELTTRFEASIANAEAQ